MCHGHFNFHFVRFETEWPKCSFETKLMFKLNVPPFMVEPKKIEWKTSAGFMFSERLCCWMDVEVRAIPDAGTVLNLASQVVEVGELAVTWSVDLCDNRVDISCFLLLFSILQWYKTKCLLICVFCFWLHSKHFEFHF